MSVWVPISSISTLTFSSFNTNYKILEMWSRVGRALGLFGPSRARN